MIGTILVLGLAASGGELRVGMDTRSRPWAFVPEPGTVPSRLRSTGGA